MSRRRTYFLLIAFFSWSALVWARLFYWQVAQGSKLAAVEKKQSLTLKKAQSPRGEIYANDDLPLVLNQPSYNLHLWRPSLAISSDKLISSLKEILFSEKEEEEGEKWAKEMTESFSGGENWVFLKKGISSEEEKEIAALSLEGLGLEEERSRFYPEGSVSAHLLGFLGKDAAGAEKGYFGLEGFYNRQLEGRSQLVMEGRGWLGRLGGAFNLDVDDLKGRDLFLHLDRAAQFIVEEELKKGIETYGAESGWAVVLETKTGGVLASAAFPSYDPASYHRYNENLFPNPLVAAHFEPGSIFKPIVLAAALEEKAVKPETKCDTCAGPVVVVDHQIRTWDGNYHPESTVTEIIQHSNNVGMVWMGRKLGLDRLIEYLGKFNFGKKTGIDLEEEAYMPIREKKNWYPIDEASASFGQGVAVTPIQMVAAFNALGNGGVWEKPQVVAAVVKDGEKLLLPRQEKRVVSEETATQVREILVNAVENGEAKWTKIPGYLVAGKTGTAQIALGGNYEEEETIVSFIGFAPAGNPRFTMLVSLHRPKTSSWGSETAAPVWFKIAKRLFYLYGIAPGGEQTINRGEG